MGDANLPAAASAEASDGDIMKVGRITMHFCLIGGWPGRYSNWSSTSLTASSVSGGST